MKTAVARARSVRMARTGEAIPSLALRTAYTNKGLGLGLGAFGGYLLAGPWGALAGVWLGWVVGNGLAISAERKATT